MLRQCKARRIPDSPVQGTNGATQAGPARGTANVVVATVKCICRAI
jgi:hypothetical protein